MFSGSDPEARCVRAVRLAGRTLAIIYRELSPGALSPWEASATFARVAGRVIGPDWHRALAATPQVVLHGDSYSDAYAHALSLQKRTRATFVHPYDDPDVIAGQGTATLEMLEDAPAIEALVIPVGGGGLCAGAAIAAAELRPGMPVFGVEVEFYPAMAQRLAGKPVQVGGPTIAEGIAVRDVGETPLAILKKLGIEVLVVPERAVEQAIVLLAEGAKVLAEGLRRAKKPTTPQALREALASLSTECLPPIFYPERRYDAILIDIDDAPDDVLGDSHSSFYSEENLRLAKRWLKDDGVLALWTNVAHKGAYEAQLKRAFTKVEVEDVTFENPLIEDQETNAIYFARG